MEAPIHWFVEYIVPYLNFLIFLGILIYFAKKPLSQLARNRKVQFDEHYRSASEALNQAKHQLESLEKRHHALSAEIETMRSKAISEAQEEAKKIIEDGKLLVKQILEDAKRTREAEFLEGQKILEQEALNLALKAVVHKLESDFDLSKDTVFIEKRLKELEAMEASALSGGV